MRHWHKLSATQVAKALGTEGLGRLYDGGNLELNVSTKYWVFSYMRQRRSREMGLGSARVVSLKTARDFAAKCREQLALGLDPLDERKKTQAAELAAAARLITFEQAASAFIADKEGGWRNEQHKADWRQSLAKHVFPVIGRQAVGQIDTPIVLKALERVWREKPELGSRLRSRIEAVLNWGTARGHRSGENPARWKGHLDSLLPSPRAVRPVVHHPALPWTNIPAFMSELRKRDGIEARCLEFMILSASRISEVTGATWSEFDLTGKTWTIPKERMKSHREHIVPLSDRALTILREVGQTREGPFLLHRTTPRKTLHRMGFDHVTQHGFRATFRTWASEATKTEHAVMEAALAHVIPDRVERAYQRGQLLDKRRKLMAAWSAFCASTADKADNVTQLAERRRGTA